MTRARHRTTYFNQKDRERCAMLVDRILSNSYLNVKTGKYELDDPTLAHLSSWEMSSLMELSRKLKVAW